MISSRQEVRQLLGRATVDDLERIALALDRWPRPTSVGVALIVAHSAPETRGELEEAIAMEIERASSAPLSRMARRAFRQAPRDELHEAITECARRLDVRVRVPVGGTLRGRLAAMTSAVVDRAVIAMPAHEQQVLLGDALERAEPRTSAPGIARAVALPALHGALGPAVLVQVVEGIVVQSATLLVGREVARAMVRAALSRAAFIPLAIGPLSWASGGALFAWEAQKPAFRKLVPALLSLGLVALRPAHG